MLRSKDEVKMTYNQDGSFDMHFISSDIHIDRNHTARVIAPSCGDGKTTMIKYIMKHYFQYGILVAVDTIDEVKMYGEYIKNELIGYTSVNGFTLTEDDYITLHSNNEDKRFEYTYASNPMDILNKAIVVCTHHKFFNNDPRIFIHTNANIRNPEMMRSFNLNSLSIYKQAVGCGPMIKGLSQIGADGVRRRQFILIDEMPKCNTLRRRFNRMELTSLVNSEYIRNPKTKSHMELSDYDSQGNPIYNQVIDEWHDPILKYSLDSKDDMYFRYGIHFANTENDLKNNTRVIDDLNVIAILDSLYDGFNNYTKNCKRNNDGYINSKGEYIPGTLKELPEHIDVTYNLTNLAGPGMQSNVWLFDGTGDLTFCGIKDFIVNIPNTNSPKFQSPVSFHKIDISSGRRFKESTLHENPNKIKSILDENVNIIIGVFKDNPNGKILIDGWKNFKFSGVKDSEIKNYELRDYLIKSDKTILLDLPRYYIDKLNPIVNKMKLSGELGPNFEFSFIYYQSGLDRATNEFRDYDSVVFLGEFIIPYSAITEHNTNMGSKTDLVKYTVHQLVQATCRLRIRKHTGEPIRVYYTSDWDERLMILLNLYISNLPIRQRADFINLTGEELMDSNYINYITSSLNNFSNRSLDLLRPKWRNIVRILCNYDKNLENAILTGSNYSFSMNLDEIHQLIPMKEKQVRSYNSLISQLKSIGIDLRITSWMSDPSVRRGLFKSAIG